jgi:poly(3-hydroxybutyrate) depolymerase
MALVVMLHGCGQDAHSFSASTHMNRLAAAAGMMVMYPEQDRLANVQGCWNWFDTRSGRAQREAASILAVVDQVCATYPIDTQRVASAGMSAGAGMAALRGRSAGIGKARPAAVSSQLPALLVIQGNRDTVVAPDDAGLAAMRWAAMAHAKPAVPRVVQRGKRYPATLIEWKLGKRRCSHLGAGGMAGPRLERWRCLAALQAQTRRAWRWRLHNVHLRSASATRLLRRGACDGTSVRVWLQPQHPEPIKNARHRTFRHLHGQCCR